MIKPREVSACFAVEENGVKIERVKYTGFGRCTISTARDAVVKLHPGRIVLSLAYMRDNDHLWLKLRGEKQ